MKNFSMQAISQGREIFAVCHNFPRIFPAELQRLGDWGRLSSGCKEVYFTPFYPEGGSHYITGDEPGWKISPKFRWSAERTLICHVQTNQM